MSEPVNLEALRWARDDRNEAHKPVAALREAIRQIEAGETAADHVIICLAVSENGENRSTWLQAGTFDTFQQYGLLERIKAGLMQQAQL